MEEKGKSKASKWRAKYPERAREQKRIYRARLRGEDIPYKIKPRVPLEIQRERRQATRERSREKLKRQLEEDPVFAEEYRLRHNEKRRVAYRINRGLPEDAVLIIGRAKNTSSDHEARLARRRELRLMSVAQKAEERAKKKAEKDAAREAIKAAREAERELKRKARAEERRIRRRDAERARRAAKVAEAKAFAAERPRAAPPASTFRPKMGRLTALMKWHGT